ncbi:hypothetical protein GQ44DRAFT_728706 [Phaeosphaeriaceae sp. PMI808]|nr:hypothetical protein GQ44DRAFT_728706 [Phaeosphaeriaceae sp. PMI808]
MAMKEPRTVPWGVRISNDDFTKMKAGFEGQSHDDKWRFRASDQSDSGNTSITITRAGLKRDFYIFHIKGGDVGDGSHIIEEFTWDHNIQETEIPEERAKREAVDLSRIILGCDFEELPEFDTSDLFSYPGNVSTHLAGQPT